MQFKSFILDTFQEKAVEAIENNHTVVVSAPTGSGKTLIADFIIEKHKNDQKRIIYTAPIKALSNQKYRDFSKEYGDDKIGLMTGDIVINPHAKVLIMTTEIYRNMAIAHDEEINNVAYVIFDEIHYINDVERGYVWEESIIYSPETVRFLCLSATIPNAKEFSDWISSIKKHQVETIVATKRNVPLEHAFFDYELGITTLEKIREAKEIPNYYRVKGKKKKYKEKIPSPNHIDLIKELGTEKMPCLFFSFSRKDCQEKARDLAKKNFFEKNAKIIQFFNEKLKDAPSEINRLLSTQILKETLPQGIAFHHAGLLPMIKVAIEELFGQGLIKVLYATETFAVGINMPAKTVCFNSLRKYDGITFRSLNTKEYFQIAGRAGRRGIDKVGYVVSMIERPHFRYNEIKILTDKDIEPIKSQFRLSVNTVLNIISRHTQKEIEYILRLSFFSYQKFGQDYDKVPAKILLATYNNIVRKLIQFGYIQKSGEHEDEHELTEKGYFGAKVFADEIALGEVFATNIYESLDEYQVLLFLAGLVYEAKEKDEFKKKYRDEQLKNLTAILHSNRYLGREKKFLLLPELTALIYPVYHGKSFFDVLKDTNLLEGDLIRFYGQIIDRIGQIRKATTNYKITQKLDNCKGIIDKALEGIYQI